MLLAATDVVILEIKRTSITRLKLLNNRRVDKASRFLEIKRTSITRLKHLQGSIGSSVRFELEIKRTSITRLKLVKVARIVDSFLP